MGDLLLWSEKTTLKRGPFSCKLREERELAIQRSEERECQAKGAARTRALKQKLLRVFQGQKGQKGCSTVDRRGPHRMRWER